MDGEQEWRFRQAQAVKETLPYQKHLTLITQALDAWTHELTWKRQISFWRFMFWMLFILFAVMEGMR